MTPFTMVLIQDTNLKENFWSQKQQCSDIQTYAMHHATYGREPSAAMSNKLINVNLKHVKGEEVQPYLVCIDVHRWTPLFHRSITSVYLRLAERMIYIFVIRFYISNYVCSHFFFSSWIRFLSVYIFKYCRRLRGLRSIIIHLTDFKQRRFAYDPEFFKLEMSLGQNKETLR